MKSFRFWAGGVFINGVGVGVYADNSDWIELRVEDVVDGVVLKTTKATWNEYRALPHDPHDGTVRAIAAARLCEFNLGD